MLVKVKEAWVNPNHVMFIINLHSGKGCHIVFNNEVEDRILQINNLTANQVAKELNKSEVTKGV